VAELEIVKYEALGNDFLLVIDRRGDTPIGPKLAAALCDRHRGIGADGVIRLSESETGEALVFELTNADGSLAETSGNGLRCAALAAWDSGLAASTTLALETTGGTAIAEVGRRSFAHAEVRVTMGHAAVTEIPSPLDGRRAFGVRTGNPHLVLLGGAIDEVDLRTVGPQLERAVVGGQNVEVVSVDDRSHLALAVWERGAGITEACGSGSVASAAAAWSIGLVDDKVEVENPGGTLAVELTGDDVENPFVILSGPARRIGTITIDLDDFVIGPAR
jgi:diaminopimelate epimerase